MADHNHRNAHSLLRHLSRRAVRVEIGQKPGVVRGTGSSNPSPSSAESVANRDRGDQRRRSVAIDLSEDEAISLMSRAGKSSGLAAEVSRWPRPAPSITYPATSGVTRTAWSAFHPHAA